ncbi:MAG: BatD family protein [Chitinophagales bacterium]
MLKGVLSFIAITVVGFIQTFGQKVEIKMGAEPESAALNEPIKIIITVEQRPDAVILPDLPDFDIIAPLGPPNVYSEMRGFGEDVEEIVISTYTALIVSKAPGKFKINGASVVHGKKLMQTNSITLQIENRKVSWEDSSAVAQKFTGFMGNNKPYTPPKTQVNYNKTTGSGNGTESKTAGEFGRGTDTFELIATDSIVKGKTGEEFKVVYTVYREADKNNFVTSIEIAAPQELEGLIILEGPNKRLHSQSNGFRKLTQGTVEYVLYAEQPGNYQIPSFPVKHNDFIIQSEPVQIVIE